MNEIHLLIFSVLIPLTSLAIYLAKMKFNDQVLRGLIDTHGFKKGLKAYRVLKEKEPSLGRLRKPPS